MTWVVLVSLGAVSYALKALGPLSAGGRQLGPKTQRLLELVAVPLLGALIVVQSFGNGRHLVLDARTPALAIAAALAWRRAPFLVIVLASAATAALARLII